MKKILLVVIAICIISFVPAVESFAQGGMMWKGGGWGMGSQYERMYDPKSVETITGEVMRVDLMTPMRGMSRGVHILLKTDKESITVHLGPSWYLENQDVKIMSKDKVEIKGSIITFQGKPAISVANSRYTFCFSVSWPRPRGLQSDYGA